MAELGVGLIGCGAMGRDLGRALLEVPAASLRAVTDPDPDAATAAGEALGAGVAADLAGLLLAPGVDAVIVASPGCFHREQVEAALAAGKHVFVEKPMALTAADCDAMDAAAARAGRLLMVGQVLRFYPCWREVLAIVRSGEIGAPWAVSVTRVGGGWEGWPQAWRNRRDRSGGLLMEVNAHEFDFMTQVCGDVERVYAEAAHYGPGPEDYPDLAFVTLRFASGAVGHLHTSTVSALDLLTGTIQGSEGTLHYTNGFAGDGEIRVARRDGSTRLIRVGDLHHEPPVRHELRLFVEAALSGGAAPIPGAEGRRNVRLAEAAYAAAEGGAPVRVQS